MPAPPVPLESVSVPLVSVPLPSLAHEVGVAFLYVFPYPDSCFLVQCALTGL